MRLSIWDEDHAVAAIAPEEHEARRLASFVSEPVDGASRRGTLTRVRARVEALVDERRAR